MTEQEFKARMTQAETMSRLSARPGYYEGYIRGLKRRYHGPCFGALSEHEQWLAMAYGLDEAGADRGRGYQHGLQGLSPHRTGRAG